MSKFNIHVNPNPPNILPAPWYRPPPEVTKGPRRRADSIIFGILIINQDAHAWFEKAYGAPLRSDHSEDITLNIDLNDLVIEKDIAFGCCAAPRRLELVSDLLVITQIERGPFIHDGPETYDEVLQEDLRPVPGVKEEEVKAWLENELGVKTSGYKSYYTNRYY